MKSILSFLTLLLFTGSLVAQNDQTPYQTVSLKDKKSPRPMYAPAVVIFMPAELLLNRVLKYISAEMEIRNGRRKKSSLC